MNFKVLAMKIDFKNRSVPNVTSAFPQGPNPSMSATSTEVRPHAIEI